MLPRVRWELWRGGRWAVPVAAEGARELAQQVRAVRYSLEGPAARGERLVPAAPGEPPFSEQEPLERVADIPLRHYQVKRRRVNRALEWQALKG